MVKGFHPVGEFLKISESILEAVVGIVRFWEAAKIVGGCAGRSWQALEIVGSFWEAGGRGRVQAWLAFWG